MDRNINKGLKAPFFSIKISVISNIEGLFPGPRQGKAQKKKGGTKWLSYTKIKQVLLNV
jgi:hypothetical protein